VLGVREEVEVMAQTMAERLIEQGKAQVIKQGIEQGQRRAKQETLLKLLRFRFGSVPESMTNEITLIQSLSHLDLLFEKAMTAWALNEIDLQNRDG
jgi:hypothetical protein